MPVGRPITLSPNIATKKISSVATASQKDFTPSGGYRINEIAVYRNGVRLAEGRDFTASDGTTVSLVSAASEGDILEFAIFDSFNVANVIVGAASSQNVDGNLNVTGTLYAGTLGGGVNASGLTGSPDITVTNITAGIATFSGIGTFAKDLYVGAAATVASDLTVKGDLNVTGDLTYDEVTGRNLNISGVATVATFHVGTSQTFDASGANVTGVITATSFSGSGSGLTGVASTDYIITGTAATFNNTTDLQNVAVSGATTTTGAITANGKVTVNSTLTASEGVHVSAGVVTAAGNVVAAVGVDVTAGGVDITAGGLVVTAGLSTFSNELRVGSNIKAGTAGVVTATSFSGSGANLTGISAGISTAQAFSITSFLS